MSKQLVIKNCDKIPPSIHKVRHNSFNITSYRKYGLLKNKRCSCTDSTYAKTKSNTLIGNDGAIICGYSCNKCDNVIYKCQKYDTERNIYNDRKATRRNLRDYHPAKNLNENTIEGNNIE